VVAIAFAAMVLAAMTLASCGDGASDSSDDAGTPAERRAAAQAARELQQAFAQNDATAICERLTRRAKERVGGIAHGKRENCPRDVHQALAVVEAGGGFKDVGVAKVGAATITGDRARVATTLRGQPHADVELRDQDGDWKLDGFFGTPSALAVRAALTMQRSPRPSGRPVSVSEGPDAPCFSMFTDGYPHIEGGCLLVFESSAPLTVDIDTPFGDFRFGRCKVDASVSLDERGRAWVTDFTFRAPNTKNNGCADIRMCSAANREDASWKSRIVADGAGRLSLRTNACVHTCIGSYIGILELPLQRERGRWHAIPAAAPMGRSGFGLTGSISTTTASAIEIDTP
jgi:hypothetical protein